MKLSLIACRGLVDIEIEDVIIRLERVNPDTVAIVRARSRVAGRRCLVDDLGTEVIKIGTGTSKERARIHELCQQHGLSDRMAKRCCSEFFKPGYEEMAS